MNLSPVDRVYARIPVTAKLGDGTPATLTGVDVAALAFRGEPTSVTVWTAATYANGVATVLLAGPAADPTGAVAIPTGGATLWIRVTDNPEIQATPAGFVSVG